MYNFRYHLVTIVSIFVSLLIGLLLGVAIAGTDFVRTTGDDMVDSLMGRFDEITATNVDLEHRLNTESALAQTYFDRWSAQRLDGRTIIILTSRENESGTLPVASVHEILRNAGAATARVIVEKPSFGIGERETLDALQNIVEPVEGQPYTDTIAQRLSDEWTYSYTDGTGTEPIDSELVAMNTRVNEQLGEGAVGAVTPQTPLEESIYAHYPLTRFLLVKNIISIEVDHVPLIEHAGAAPTLEQTAALEFTAMWNVPYAANGIVNLFSNADTASTSEDGADNSASVPTIIVDPVGLEITNVINSRGNSDSLPYPTWLTESARALVGTDTVAGGTNYYAVLVAVGDAGTIFASAAYDNDLSCVTTPEDVNGHYSVVALLSGASHGIYGRDRPNNAYFPPLPSDLVGIIPFVD